mmetsp:Transcript_22658/g.64389  ORF Transcript_22658/g.64389 Transcript_22658/m.64389 type:complete len:302 (+) Transcript_22658:57-962(+)
MLPRELHARGPLLFEGALGAFEPPALMGTEPLERVIPPLFMRHHWLVVKIAFGVRDIEPAVDCEHLHRERSHAKPIAGQKGDKLEEVANGHHRVVGQMKLVEERAIPVEHPRLVKHAPKLCLPSIRDNVELTERRRALEQLVMSDDQTMAIVVHVGHRHIVVALAEHTETATPLGVEQVWQEERVARPIHLVRRDSHGEQPFGRSCAQSFFPHRLGLGVWLKELARFADLQLVFTLPDNVVAVKARRWRRGSNQLANAKLLARLDDVERPKVIDFVVCFVRVERTNQRSNVPHALCVPESF